MNDKERRMACRVQDSGVSSAVELMAERGFEGLPAALAALINEAMRWERERHLGAGPWARTAGRRGQVNGDKPKTMRTRVGELALALPQGLTVFGLPETHRRRRRTPNTLGRVNKELKRRTRVATLFPNEEACLRLVTAVAMEISVE